MAIDIAGSPIDHLQFLEAHSQTDTVGSRDQQGIIRRSFLVNSLANVVVAASGITPIVYYAENHVGWQAGGRTGRATVIVAACFFACGLIGVGFWYFQLPIGEFISRFSAMPTLFFVGSWLVADAFANPATLGSFSPFAGRNSGTDEIDGSAQGDAGKPPTIEGRVLNFLPAAVTTILATVTTLDNAIAAGILADGFTYLFPEDYRGTRTRSNWQFSLVYLGAFSILAWAIYVKFSRL